MTRAQAGLRVWCALLCALFAQVSMARDMPKWYAGAGAGIATTDIGMKDWNDGSLSTGTVDNTGPSWKVLAGYRLGEDLWLELSWLTLRNAKFQGNSVGNLAWAAGAVKGSADTDGLTVGLLRAWPFWKDRLAVYVKGGLFMWDTTAVRDELITGRKRTPDDGIDPLYGVGLEWRADDHWALRAAWERTFVDIAFAGNYAIDTGSLDLIFRFSLPRGAEGR